MEWTFVASSVPGVWILKTQGAEWVTYPDGIERRHDSMWCARCRVNVPVVNPVTYGPFLNWLAQADNPLVHRVSPNVVEVPLDVMAYAAGESWKVPE
jgi:hypothetical protein